MLKLAEHIVETRAAEFKPVEFVDHYETAVVGLLKQNGKFVGKIAAKAPAPRGQRYRPPQAQLGAVPERHQEGEVAASPACDAEGKEESEG